MQTKPAKAVRMKASNDIKYATLNLFLFLLTFLQTETHLSGDALSMVIFTLQPVSHRTAIKLTKTYTLIS